MVLHTVCVCFREAAAATSTPRAWNAVAATVDRRGGVAAVVVAAGRWRRREREKEKETTGSVPTVRGVWGALSVCSSPGRSRLCRRETTRDSFFI